MALHGAIAVNGQVIGGWQATRMEPLESGRDVYDYDCQVDWWSPHSLPQRHTFVLAHYYSHGAVALAAKVLGKAAGLYG